MRTTDAAPARLTRRGRRTVVALAVLLCALVAYAVLATPLGTLLGLGGGPACRLTAGETTLDWSTEQAMTATTVAGVGTRIGATLNGVAEAVRRGLDIVDQHQDAGALSPEQARQVYRTLPDVARPDPQSLAVAAALLGHRGEALTCVVPALDDLPGETAGSNGLTPRAERLRTQMRAVFGRQPLGGFAPGGVREGHIAGSAHYDGRAVDVFFRPVNEANQRLGRQQAQWAVAHAEALGVATVIFDRQIWSAQRSVQGWRTYTHPSGRTDNPILNHEDHVHLDVAG